MLNISLQQRTRYTHVIGNNFTQRKTTFYPSIIVNSLCFINYFFRNVLQKASELGLQSLAFCVINCVKRNYPPDEGAHLALRK